MSNAAIRGLSITYPADNQPALPPLDLDINTGENILLAGPSGCGKSSLALALQGLIPRVIEAEKTGTLTVNETELEHWTTAQACRHVGILFQDPETQFCMETVEDEIVFGMENIGLSIEEITSRLEHVLEITGLREHRFSRLTTLSGGLKQKAATACLLALDPAVFVLDEPTANLDPKSSEDFIQLWINTAARGNKTLLFIEHNMETGLEYIDRVIALRKEGGVLLEGPPRTVFREKAHILEQEGIHVPEVCRTARRVEQEGQITWDPFPLNLEEWEVQCAQRGIQKRNEPAPDFSAKSPVAPPLIEAENLTFSYGAERILENVSFTLHTGEFAALCGSNGAGKSTLAHLLTGLEQPEEGTLFRKGKESSRYRTEEIMKQTGFVFQNPEHQFICDSVEDELTYGWRMTGSNPEFIRAELEEMLTLFQLREKRDANPFSLSQGQKRRLSAAVMLAGEQELLILDEPTFGQDESGTNALMEMLKKWQQRGGSIIMITHDMELVDRYADKVLLLHEKSTAFQGGTDTFFQQNDLLEKASINIPVSRKLKPWVHSLERQEAPC
ncbi:energy-coupling factor transport system ATP-binding protein [Salibacterium qingdaonense]|uniref:Energy-coupling factor transport system ATP-binding protein n=2 Tax=Salibacterium qingdaonense TaxID=266892 RepID=A0A1I4QTX0_9BACI|nr:energy-coupling factor transport system ATP-binding protein [Salibacterium qingdaonense]